jgi:hypothetical protein
MTGRSRGEVFNQLRRYVTHDAKQILSLARGGNYAAALLICIGSEALSRIQGLGNTAVFRRLVGPYGLDEPMADDLFDAVRQELAHMYDTKLIKVGARELGIYVGWGGHRHMSILRDRDPHGLYLNVKTMWADFEAILDEAAEQLTSDNRPLTKDVEKRLIKQVRPASIRGWRRLFEIHA